MARLEEKHRSEMGDLQSKVAKAKDEHSSEYATRTMLDENLKVLTRRINDQEIELADKQDKVKTLERANA